LWPTEGSRAGTTGIVVLKPNAKAPGIPFGTPGARVRP
jgi:hypothetical protein